MSPWYMVIVGYLLGGVPFALLYDRLFASGDLLQQGSQNPGATNVIRNYGWGPGVGVLALDVLKGVLPVWLTFLLGGPNVGHGWPVIVGAAAILGHVYSPYLGFSGGKGVATSTGVFLVLSPLAVAMAFAGFLALVATTRYMSAGSLTGALILPLACGYFYGFYHPITWAGAAAAVVVWWRHRGNLRRLIQGEENRFF